MIVTGVLAPGERVNEVHLARELGISRTPLREALSCLVAEGALTAIARKGFFVSTLSVEELKHIYPIRALLDPEALRQAGIPDDRKLKALARLNREIKASRDVETRISLDDRWHLELVSDCNNPILIELIERLIRRTHRYEYGYLRDKKHLAVALDEHARILKALGDGDLEAACGWLRQNMTSGLQPIVAWLAGLEAGGED